MKTFSKLKDGLIFSSASIKMKTKYSYYKKLRHGIKEYGMR